MKYIKTYESVYDEGKYWKIRLDTPYYEISLDKIGMSYKEQTGYLDINYIKTYSDLTDVMYIGTGTVKHGTDYYWASTRRLDFNQFEYMGEPEITENDIKEWNFKNDIKKYNL